MAMAIGDADAGTGMTGQIYAQLETLLSPPLQTAVDNSSADAKPVAQHALDTARQSWKQLGFAIATGVVEHLVANMEIVGIQTTGAVAAAVSGSTGSAPPAAAHTHTVALNATQSALTFTQSGPTLGHVK
jgi:hypothetical protein